MNFIKALFDKQYVWIALACIVVSLFIYGEVTATRFFGGATTQEWKPNGANSHNSLNHK